MAVNNLRKTYQGKKVLVTGAEGFIGRHLVKALLSCGAEIHGLYLKNPAKDISGKMCWHKADVRNGKALKRLVKKVKPDFVFHLAALLEKGEKPELVNRIMATNFYGTFNLLQALAGAKFSKLVFLGSGEEYGKNKAPFNEKQNVQPVSPYGVSKAAAENICLVFFKIFNYPVVILRPAVVYGPGQKNKMFIPSLLNTLVKNQPFKMSGGKQKRDFIYIDDLIEAILAATVKPVKGEIINIGSGKSYSLKQVVAIARKISGSKGIISFDLPYRQSEIMNYSFDISKAKKFLGWQPAYSLEDGLKEIIRENKDG